MNPLLDKALAGGASGGATCFRASRGSIRRSRNAEPRRGPVECRQVCPSGAPNVRNREHDRTASKRSDDGTRLSTPAGFKNRVPLPSPLQETSPRARQVPLTVAPRSTLRSTLQSSVAPCAWPPNPTTNRPCVGSVVDVMWSSGSWSSDVVVDVVVVGSVVDVVVVGRSST